MLLFYFCGWDSRHLFVSDSWYCQIQTTKLIINFLFCFYLFATPIYILSTTTTVIYIADSFVLFLQLTRNARTRGRDSSPLFISRVEIFTYLLLVFFHIKSIYHFIVIELKNFYGPKPWSLFCSLLYTLSPLL